MDRAEVRDTEKEEGGLWETVKVVIQALLIAVVVRTLFFQPFNIPSGSLVPTLLIGDYLFVSKYSYGYSKHSMPFSPPLFDGRVWGSEPKRGDIAVFKLPKDNSTDYIKRVIGLPGDRIQVLGGVLHVNGSATAARRIPSGAPSPCRCTRRPCRTASPIT
jgi:signal peptidase I